MAVFNVLIPLALIPDTACFYQLFYSAGPVYKQTTYYFSIAQLIIIFSHYTQKMEFFKHCYFVYRKSLFEAEK